MLHFYMWLLLNMLFADVQSHANFHNVCMCFAWSKNIISFRKNTVYLCAIFIKTKRLLHVKESILWPGNTTQTLYSWQKIVIQTTSVN